MTSFAAAMQQLRGSQKTSRGVSLYSRYINRPGGRVFAAAASLTSMTPNQMSLLSAAVTAVGLVMLATQQPTVLLGVLVWAALALGFMLDSSDGQLARLRGSSSAAGEWLDHTLDAAKMVAVHAAVLIAWFRFFDFAHAGWLLVPLAFQLVAVVMFAGGTLAQIALRGQPGATAPASTARSVVLLVGDYGVMCLVFLVWGWPSLFVLVYSLLALGNLVLLALLSAKWFRQLTRLRKPAPQSVH